MLNKRDAKDAIALRLASAQKLITECEKIAMESKVDFELDIPNGSYLSFDGSGDPEVFGNEDGTPTGWDHSQC